jgi:hypothetical protein
MEYYLVVNRSEVVLLGWMNHDSIMLGERSQAQKKDHV